MSPKFRQDHQDNRVWCLEQLLRHEGFLDPRIYECADYCASAGIINDVKDVIKEWDKWKRSHPPRTFQANRL